MKRLRGILLILGVAALVPLGWIALSRSHPSSARPVHPILDMDLQPKFKAQSPNPMFVDGRAMRPRLPGTVAREDLVLANPVLTDPNGPRPVAGWEQPYALTDAAAYDRILLGVEKQAAGKMGYLTQFPLAVSMDVMRRGQERFGIYCTPCHGLSGYGDGMVARRAAEMQAAGSADAAGWVAAANYHTDELRGRAVGSLYNTITNGVRNMPAYGSQIPPLDRWAMVAYVKALQRSQNARAEDVPASEQENNGRRLTAAVQQ